MVRIATLDDGGKLTPGQVPALATLGATATGEALIEAASAAAARTTLELGGAATLAVGTTTGTVAAGDDSRITGALAAANLDTAATALDANAASALRVQQDARLLSTFVARDGYEIVICAGQSNAEQSDTTIPVADDDPRIHYWDADTSQIAQVPTTQTYLAPSFAREYVKSLHPGRRVLIVQTAMGATGFSTSTIDPTPGGYTAGDGSWDRTINDPVDLYDRMIARATAAMSALETLYPDQTHVYAALLWSHGEGDTPRLDQATYAAKLDDLITQARVDLADSTLPVVVGSMVPEYVALEGQAYTTAVAAALAATPERLAYTGFAYGPRGYPKHGEPIHYSSAGQVVRGRLFYEALLRARINVSTTRPMTPANLRVTRGDLYVVTAEWEPTLCRVSSIEAEISTDRGATWTDMVLDTESRLRATSGADPGAPVTVRVRNINGAYTGEWATSDTLPPISDTALPTPTWKTGDAGLPGGLDQTQPACLYACYTLDDASSVVTVNARATDSTSLFVVSAQQPSTGYGQVKAVSQSSTFVNFADPKAAQGSHVSVARVNAGATSVASRRDLAAIGTGVHTGGSMLYQTMAFSATGGGTLHEVWFFHGSTAEHSEATMTKIQRILAARAGIDLPTS